MRKYRNLQKIDPWIFYYEYTDQEEFPHKTRRAIYSVRVCKVPSRTKDWKELQLKYSSTGWIDSIGYIKESELNN